MKNIKVYLLIISFSFMFDIGISQDSDQWQQVTEKEGLPSNKITDIRLDSNGNNWIVSDQGISKYDGEHWYHFTEKNNLIKSDFYRLILDEEGNHWIIHENGISRYDGNNVIQVETVKIAKIKRLFLDADGKIWICERGKISIYDGSKFEVIEDKDIKFITCNLEDSKGNVWIGGISRIKSLSKESFLFIFNGDEVVQQTSKKDLPFNEINSIYEDDKKNIWIGSEKGLYKKEQSNPSLRIIDTEIQYIFEKPVKSIFQDTDEHLCVFLLKVREIGNRKKYLGNIVKLIGNTWEYSPEISSLFYVDILHDSKGNDWISYDNGVFKYDGITFTKFNELGLENVPGSRAQTTKLFEDSRGNLWVGTTRNVCKYDGDYWNCYFKEIKSSVNVSSNSVNDICEDSKGNILVGTSKGVFIYGN